MSTATDGSENETELTPRALNSTLIPVVTVLFFGGVAGVPAILEWFRLPPEPWIAVIWEFWFPTEIRSYLLRIGAVFSLISIVGGFAKFWFSDRLIEKLRLGGDIKRLQIEDWTIIVIYVVLFIPVALLVDYPFTWVAMLQGVLMVVLQNLFIAIPSYLTTSLSLPRETESAFVKTKVFAGSMFLAFMFTHVALFGMRAVEFYL